MKLIDLFEIYAEMHDSGIDEEKEEIQGLYSNEMLWISPIEHI
jgi:hypothetical protein